MKRHYFASLLLFILAGCAFDESYQSARLEEQQITIKAIKEDDTPETRTMRDEDGKVYWCKGDQISLFYGSGTNGGSVFTSTQEEDLIKVTNFVGTITAITGGGEISVNDTYFWGLYPYNENATCDGTSITTTLSSHQVAYPGSYANGTNISVGRSQGLIMGFYNACGGFRFSLNKEGVKKVTFRGKNGENLAGELRVSFVNGKINTEILEGENEVVLEAPAGEYFEPGELYYIVLAPAALSSGFTVKAETFTEEATFTYDSSITIEASNFKSKKLMDTGLTWTKKTGNIPIEDANFKAYLVENFYGDGDGEISYEEAETIETLDIQTSDIESISGIEYMPNLKTLICSGSETTTRAAGGPGQLTVLDVSNNTELEYLDCSNNQITRLDVSNNPELETLICTGNPMSEVKMAASQTISDMQLPDGTLIVYDGVYVQPANEIWYKTSDGEAVTYTVASDTGNELDESLCKAPKDNDGVGIIRFTAPLTTIDSKGLENQNNLTSVTLPNSIETIGSSAFEYCSSLSEVNLSSSLKTIGAWAFGSTALGDIDFLPEGLVRIGAGAFEGVHATTVVIPETVEYLATSNRGDFPMGNPFYNCDVLETFVGKFATEDGKALVETAPDGKTYFISYAVARDDDSYVVPEVDAISYFAFWGALSLKQIELPSSLESIYDAAFLACRSLENITIPSGIQLIGGDAFVNCRSLQWVKVLSSSVPSGRAPYAYYYGGMFRCSSGYSYDIYVPSSSVEAYKAASYWSDFADRIKPLTSLLEAVDLGLSVKWASFNLGASTPEEYGDYYAWGESSCRESFSASTYKWASEETFYLGGNKLTKYCPIDKANYWGGVGNPDGKNVLDEEDDAAHALLGGNWRTPTIIEWNELFSNCTWEWVNGYRVGYRITSKINDNSIFLPAAGYWDHSYSATVGPTGSYMSSSLYESDPRASQEVHINSDYHSTSTYNRWEGLSVRPVWDDNL